MYPGADGLVRAVDFKTDTGVYRRGIQALALLEPVSDVQKVIASHLRGRMFERSKLFNLLFKMSSYFLYISQHEVPSVITKVN